MAVIIDSLGRRWNPALHPRGKDGKFIRVLSKIRFFLDGMSVPLGTGSIVSIKNKDSIAVKVTGVNKNGKAYGKLKPNDLVHVRASNIESIDEKASLSQAAKSTRFGNISVSKARLKTYGDDKEAFKKSVRDFAISNKFTESEADEALKTLDGEESDTGKYIVALHA